MESRFVSVAVNNAPQTINLLHMTYAQQSIIGAGGYMPEDVWEVQKIMSCAIRTAADIYNGFASSGTLDRLFSGTWYKAFGKNMAGGLLLEDCLPFCFSL